MLMTLSELETTAKKQSWIDKNILPRKLAPFMLTIGDRRQGKTALATRLMEDFLTKVKNEDGEKDGLVIFLGSPTTPKLIPKKFRDRIRVTTELFNEYLFEDADRPKLFILDEAIIFGNNKDWQEDTTKLFEKFSVVSAHFACRILFNIQTLKFLSALIQLVDYRFYKKCNSELIHALKTGTNRQQFVKDYDWYIKRCPKNVFIIDDKQTSLEDGFERPRMMKFKLPSFWTDELSKSWSGVTKQEFMEIVNPTTSEILKLDVILNSMITYIHISEHLRNRKVTIDNSRGVLAAASNTDVSTHKARATMPVAKSLLSKYKCPICNPNDAYWINSDFKDLTDEVVPAIEWLEDDEKDRLLAEFKARKDGTKDDLQTS